MFTTGITSKFDYFNFKYAVSSFFVALFQFYNPFLVFLLLICALSTFGYRCRWWYHAFSHLVSAFIDASIYLSIFGLYLQWWCLWFIRVWCSSICFCAYCSPSPTHRHRFLSLIITFHFTYILLCTHTHNTIATIHRVYIWVSECVRECATSSSSSPAPSSFPSIARLKLRFITFSISS